MKWATPAGGGKVLQVVYSKLTTEASTSSSSFTDIGLSATITPAAATSKILVLVTHSGIRNGNSTSVIGKLRLVRGATTILSYEGQITYLFAQINPGGTSTNILDDPNTTSATTYKVQFANDGSDTFFLNTGGASTMTLLEIGA
jgi:hypothetical protein